MLQEITKDTETKLFDYFMSERKRVPYYFHVDFEQWHHSMFNDCDDDGKPLFSHLETFLLVDNNEIKGFIQYGLTSFVFDKNGRKNYAKHYAIIRNIHFIENTMHANLLLDKAMSYFNDLGCKKRHAYFHYFGMTCYAKQGKLHDSEFYIEKLLGEYGYVKEHENIYYTKSLQTANACNFSEIDFVCENDGASISFVRNNEKIGGCALNFMPNSDVCFLKWIYIDKKYSHQGLGTKCMHKLCCELKRQGISRLDTDTADSNMAAQRYYFKTGFSDMGRMRSYLTI